MLCQNFCAYYKPGKNEELACGGYLVIHDLIWRGKNISRKRPNRLAAVDSGTIQRIRDRVCAACDFRIDGCDFILKNGGATPCGGFVLLSHLLASGELKPDDL